MRPRGFSDTSKQNLVSWNASARWAVATQFALALSLTSSQQDLQAIAEGGNDNYILQETRNAAQILQVVLQGKHDTAIEEELVQHQVPRENWWSALFKVVEGAISASFNPILKTENDDNK